MRTEKGKEGEYKKGREKGKNEKKKEEGKRNEKKRKEEEKRNESLPRMKKEALLAVSLPASFNTA